jgi:hypothetical protein
MVKNGDVAISFVNSTNVAKLPGVRNPTPTTVTTKKCEVKDIGEKERSLYEHYNFKMGSGAGKFPMKPAKR